MLKLVFTSWEASELFILLAVILWCRGGFACWMVVLVDLIDLLIWLNPMIERFNLSVSEPAAEPERQT